MKAYLAVFVALALALTLTATESAEPTQPVMPDADTIRPGASKPFTSKVVVTKVEPVAPMPAPKAAAPATVPGPTKSKHALNLHHPSPLTADERAKLVAYDLKDATTHKETTAKISALIKASAAVKDTPKVGAIVAQATALQTQLDATRQATLAANPDITALHAKLAYEQSVKNPAAK